MFKCWTLFSPSQVQCSFGCFRVFVQGYLTLSLPANCLHLIVFRTSNSILIYSAFISVSGILYNHCKLKCWLFSWFLRGFRWQFSFANYNVIGVKLKWRLFIFKAVEMVTILSLALYSGSSLFVCLEKPGYKAVISVMHKPVTIFNQSIVLFLEARVWPHLHPLEWLLLMFSHQSRVYTLRSVW